MGSSQGETQRMHSFIYSFIHSCNKRAASVCLVMRDDTGVTAMNETHRVPALLTGLPAQEWKQTVSKDETYTSKISTVMCALQEKH